MMIGADQTRQPNPMRGLLAGLAAGLAGAAAMSAFQAAATRLSGGGDEDGDKGDPADVKAADRLKQAAGGAPLKNADKPAAGALVHYALGAALGIAYGIVAEYRPEITSAGGTAFGEAVAMVLDEGAVPAIGLSPSATATPVRTHLFGFASHAVFGRVLEATRAGLVAIVDR